MTIQSIVGNAISDHIIPGAIIKIVQGEETILFDSQGYQDIEKQLPLMPNTLFRIYSMTKPITAVALMMLVEQGLLKLDDAVADYLPAFKDMQVHTASGLVQASTPISIRHLLTHSAGLTYSMMQDNPYVSSLYAKQGVNEIYSRLCCDLETHINKLARLPLISQPGTVYRYSESLSVIARLIEVLSGLSYREFLIERIFKPLNMSDTDFYTPPEKIHRLATLYEQDKSAKGFKQSTAYGGDYSQPALLEAGGVGLVSTVDDYLQFAQMLLNKGAYCGQRLLTQESISEIMSDQYTGDALQKIPQSAELSSSGMGHGFAGTVVVNPKLRNVMGSVGEYAWLGWASTFFWVDPVKKIIGVFMTQLITKPDATLSLGQDIRREVYSNIGI